MASRNESLELTEEDTWEVFPRFAKKYVKQFGLRNLWLLRPCARRLVTRGIQ